MLDAVGVENQLGLDVFSLANNVNALDVVNGCEKAKKPRIGLSWARAAWSRTAEYVGSTALMSNHITCTSTSLE